MDTPRFMQRPGRPVQPGQKLPDPLFASLAAQGMQTTSCGGCLLGAFKPSVRKHKNTGSKRICSNVSRCALSSTRCLQAVRGAMKKVQSVVIHYFNIAVQHAAKYLRT
eukprot:1157625-Pelagomonas_calceolata.AAC.3